MLGAYACLLLAVPHLRISESASMNFLGSAPIGRTPKRAYSARGRSRQLLETPFSEPLLRTLLRTPFLM